MRALLRELRPAVLVHAAWYVAHGKFWTAPENAAWVEASTALADAFAGRRLVGLGSCAEYDWAGEGTSPWSETRRIAPATPYGQAKAALAARWAALGERRGIAVAWARLFHLFGPGEHPDRLVPAVLRALLEGREAATGSGLALRDFVGTGFLGRALAALAASGVVGPSERRLRPAGGDPRGGRSDRAADRPRRSAAAGRAAGPRRAALHRRRHHATCTRGRLHRMRRSGT